MSVSVSAERAEAARAQMLALFPDGFEEVEQADGVELVAYTDAGGEERMWRTFGRARAADVDADWHERWKEFHQPVRVGPFWLGPPWLSAPADAVPVVIDPGRAFGTGAHPTTRLCLELLLELEPASLVDVGCGSGVLAIAASALGCSPVTALDVDDHAVAAATANATANGASVAVVHADATNDPIPHAAIAIANVTRELVEKIARRLTCKHLVVSGYLVSDSPRLSSFRHVRRTAAEGWAADLYERRPE